MGQSQSPKRPSLAKKLQHLLIAFSVAVIVLVDGLAIYIMSISSAEVLSLATVAKMVLAGSIACGIAVALGMKWARRLVAPIEKLAEGARGVASGNFSVDLKFDSHDEIQEVGESMNAMSAKIRELFRESVEKVLLESELDVASLVQQNLLPPPILEGDRVQIYSFYQAASRCGGDWWGAFHIGDKTVIGIADATGHGIQCALMTASARGCFSILQKIAEEDPSFLDSPSRMLQYANRVVYDSTGGKIQMTFFLAVLDMEKNTVRYANAGHNPPWLFRRGGERYSLRSLVGYGSRLGEVAECAPFEEKTADLHADDLLFFYTDGLMEGRAASGDMYGKKRTRGVLEKNLQYGPRKVVDELVLDFLMHNRGTVQDDDVTIAVARILPQSPAQA